MYLTRHPTSNVKMKAQFILACIMTFIGIAGFITLLTLGLIYKFGIVMIGLLVFFFVVAVVGMTSAVKNHKEPEHETSDVMRWYGV
jgi:fatty acid desaturase